MSGGGALPRARKSLGVLLGVLVLVFGIGVAGMASGGQVANAAIWDFCKADETFPAPLPSGGIQGRSIQDFDIISTTVGDKTLNSIETAENPATAYEGAGLTWYTFGASCADFPLSGTTMIANFMYQVFSLFPAKMLGIS